ncbi:MAG: heavy-metal-associated domain-containing protein [Proteobacteria bacterium]|nr:heavy-metal-associated domain-containing protein [Pseudomonadota bacterium]MBU1711380.1 heavy-metal-associated domain-containing protein [Pseudomonadota bacterium]
MQKPHTNKLPFFVLLFLLVMATSSVHAENRIRTLLNVQNLSCGSCLNRIQVVLESLDGFLGMNADLGTGRVAVVHEAVLSGAEIAATITALGYPASVFSSAISGIENSGPLTVAQETSASAQLPEDNGADPGCSGGRGCGSACGASSSSWQKLYDKYFGSRKK